MVLDFWGSYELILTRNTQLAKSYFKIIVFIIFSVSGCSFLTITRITPGLWKEIIFGIISDLILFFYFLIRGLKIKLSISSCSPHSLRFRDSRTVTPKTWERPCGILSWVLEGMRQGVCSQQSAIYPKNLPEFQITRKLVNIFFLHHTFKGK